MSTRETGEGMAARNIIGPRKIQYTHNDVLGEAPRKTIKFNYESDDSCAANPYYSYDTPSESETRVRGIVSRASSSPAITTTRSALPHRYANGHGGLRRPTVWSKAPACIAFRRPVSTGSCPQHGFETPILSNATVRVRDADCGLPASPDFDNDGRDDIFELDRLATSGRSTPADPTVTFDQLPDSIHTSFLTSHDERPRLGDVNGDGGGGRLPARVGSSLVPRELQLLVRW